MNKQFLLCIIAAILAITFRFGIGFINISLAVIFLAYLAIRARKNIPLVLLTAAIFLLLANFNIKQAPTSIKGEYSISEKHQNYYVLKNSDYKFVCYDDYDFNLHAKLYVEGETSKIVTNKSSSVSSFNDYLAKQGINYQLTITKYQIVNDGDTLRAKIAAFLTRDLEVESASMVSLLLLGDKTYLRDFYNQLIDLSVVQLFVISGFHLNLINGVFDFLFKKHPKVLLFTPFILVPYLWLLNFSLPVMRAFLFIVLARYCKYFNLSIQRIDILSLIALSFLLYDYHLLYNLSFQLTFTVSLAIELLNLYQRGNFVYKWILRPLLLQLAIVPILMNINYQITPLAFIYNTLLALPISLLYMLSWLVVIFKFIDAIYYPYVKGLMSLIEFLARNSPIIITGRPYFPFVFLIYASFGLLVYYGFANNKKLFYLSFSLLLSATILNIYHCDIFATDNVTFLDVGQGDATLICDNHNKTTVLIDTGGSLYYDVATSKLIPYLKANGIREIDYVLLTHLDYDHSGALDSLKDNYTVKEVIYGYEHTYIKCDDLEFYNLNHYGNGSDNENSAVFYFEQAKHNFLVMGDAPIEIEEKIIIDNPSLDVDVLRLGHHGSKTSSSQAFLEYADPKLSIISVGKNIYGHPHQEVLARLKRLSLNYLRTDEAGNIIVTSNGVRLRV